MKRFLSLIIILIIGYSWFIFYKNDLSYEKSVDELTQKMLLIKNNLSNWYKKNNRIVSPLPFFSFPIIDFLVVFFGMLGGSWFLIHFFARESK